jgi:hypothetical protein
LYKARQRHGSTTRLSEAQRLLSSFVVLVFW